ncbi:PREDICTED: transmembrane and ubiquitin-like domain-containing protein 1 [Dufourea novaeangliae]|uniref:transmembrane and ubiquitin-like domain-containing protein 1 n=1 Tax=Dufourea novaeangliae TaxID=178035 RepID=UPI0007670F9D|nr:PREDICTED: transmembrane and ubiquitin-like domain-containing protein 1 [Dufourea novaeangliae]XP_015438085.1 PREDICTED: transmembrane and ubiquitin-like domain-containing protein 1 [Dufourea novaeangliae]XP_015438086.1 PREDICTED: transmembrane and ubiquitin-like domain-containing protein 1 [Dufourea novaeangliae]KZC15185.1 Transmembrane and ubiquitin-like domain-containing protein 1 [Dufourea novaeangliae]
MTLVEGVGDEVTHFFIVVVTFLIGWLAWCSTSIADQPLIRTVLILQRRTRTRIAELRSNHQNVSSFNRPPNLEISEEESAEPISDDNSDTTQSCPEPSVADTNAGVSPETHRTSEATATEEVLIEAMDSYNNDSTALLQRQTKVNTTEEANVPTSTGTDTVECSVENLSTNNAIEISIRLIFINDDQKVVTGSLKELLGDFKRRHFQIELEAHKLVRLIFKGRVLQPDSQTLEQCGLHNNCVVHCLVHQPRPSPASPQTSTLNNSSSLYFNPQSFSDIPAGTGISSVHNEWNLSRLLVSILTLMLCLAWYSRYHYAQLFTATTTLALYALTAIFTVSLFSNYFPDQDNIRNME